MASWYTLVIYTASMPEYADPVIDWLDGGKGYFQKKLYRESCFLQNNGSYIKDLALVEKDLSRVCFMDNSPISYSWNKGEQLRKCSPPQADQQQTRSPLRVGHRTPTMKHYCKVYRYSTVCDLSMTCGAFWASEVFRLEGLRDNSLLFWSRYMHTT